MTVRATRLQAEVGPLGLAGLAGTIRSRFRAKGGEQLLPQRIRERQYPRMAWGPMNLVGLLTTTRPGSTAFDVL